ncbi:LacI family DNA-binding transcriptional regulator [Deinococcus cellulosilyticus]|uniref:Repressor n=1 Tax=Deinococcus cellulosilyticus (strain DSM 18568 / NBRC 106333 / KACC 11606 / 5516J-15) TaxID=1223518 RepID=A0A511N446_DEIC1|nr:LacI family DNA-binding transcriptional regulator [Deinococcus cellulosilyticus]GEM47654.1 repressor [Deinococcus cellulosilyticus NBRC 106333 = KACC 11606]
MTRRRITIKDVSALAGVSVSTVSRVLNASGPISEETRKVVMQAASDLKYQPNPLARGLVKNQLGGVGVLIPWLGGPYFCSFLEGVQDVVRDTPFRMVISSEQAVKEKEAEALAYLLENDADGVIYYGDSLRPEDIAEINPLGKPVVLLGQPVTDSYPCVAIDDEVGAFLATRYLIDNGHRQIAHLTGDAQQHVTASRLSGYRRALDQAGIPFDPHLIVHADYSEQGGYRGLQHLLGRAVDFTALFCGNDQMAIGAYQALREFNKQIPEDVSVVGFDNISFAQYMHPPLTTVQVPIRSMGRVAAQILIGNIEGQEVFPAPLEAELIIRRSVLRR